MMDMWAAVALSVGNKAKAHDKRGDIVIIERHFSRIQCAFILHVIDKHGSGSSNSFDNNIGILTDILIDRHGLNLNAVTWLPVGIPFPDEVTNQ
jgi:hypothetical protein